ncbi:MAG: 4-oxalocrotonate tautomerase [Propionivibrio sp.]|nr:4-oxalocrotonate tautomerase [Propionivibrio sp.]
MECSGRRVARREAHESVYHRAFMIFNETRSIFMPTMHIEMFAGRTPEKKRELVEALTKETCRVLGCSPEAVDIILTDVARENWATGGKLWSDK